MTPMNYKWKKGLSLLLSLVMVLQCAPVNAFAATTDNLCGHHTEHTVECGYVEAVEGVSCGHAHDGFCGYAEAVAGADCTHAHDASCGFVEAVAEVPCACVADENGAIVHTEGCGYAAPVAGSPCGHAHDGSCGYVAAIPGSDCTHGHDEACGYVAAVEGHECHFECSDCAAEADTPAPEQGAVEKVQALIDALPEVTADNAEAVMTQLTAIDEAKLDLAAEELAQVDFGRYDAAIAALSALAGQPGAEEPDPVADDVASVTMGGNTTNYTSLSKAFSAVASATEEDNAVVTLLADITLDSNADIWSGVLTLDLNGHTITCNGTEAAIWLYNSAKLTIIGSGGFNVVYGIEDSAVVLHGSSVLTIAGGNFNKVAALFRSADAQVNITGGTFNYNGQVIKYGPNSVAKITGGTFAVEPDAYLVPEGYAAKQDESTGKWVVAEGSGGSVDTVVAITDIIYSDYNGNGAVAVDEANKTYTVTIPEGSESVTVTVTVKGRNLDLIPEGNDQYGIGISSVAYLSPEMYDADTGTMTLTIEVDDEFVDRYADSGSIYYTLTGGRTYGQTAWKLKVVAPAPVASVTPDGGRTIKYDSLVDAFNAADGKTATIKLLRDYDAAYEKSQPYMMSTDSVITFDLGGYTLSYTNLEEDVYTSHNPGFAGSVVIQNGAIKTDNRFRALGAYSTYLNSMTIKGNVVIETTNAFAPAVSVQNNMMLIIEEGATITSNNSDTNTSGTICVYEGGTVIINGGTIVNNGSAPVIAPYNFSGNTTVVVNGGNFATVNATNVYFNVDHTATVTGNAWHKLTNAIDASLATVAYAENTTVYDGNTYGLAGSEVALTVTPAAGMKVSSLLANETEATATESGYSFSMPGKAVTITGTVVSSCDHANATYPAGDITDTQHKIVCTCGYEAVEDHTMDNTTGDCGLCKADMAVVATITQGETVTYYATADAVFAAAKEITGSGTITILADGAITKNAELYSTNLALVVEEGAVLTLGAILYFGGCSISGGGTINGTENYAQLLLYSNNTLDGLTVGANISNSGTINGGTFSGKVENKGSISGGDFTGMVTNTNNGVISGGTFSDAVNNLFSPDISSFVPSIIGGTFHGSVTNEGGIIRGGTFNGALTNKNTNKSDETGDMWGMGGVIVETIYGTITNTATPTTFTLGENFSIVNEDGEIDCTSHITKDGSCRLCGADCDHSGNQNEVTFDEETHSFTCSDCQVDVNEAHRFDETSGKCAVCQAQVAASVTIGGTTAYHLTLGEAVSAVANCTEADNAVVKLLDDVVLSEEVEIASGVFTIDLGGKTVTSEGDDTFVINGSGANVTFDNGTIEAVKRCVIVRTGTANIFEVSLSVTVESSTAAYVNTANNGSLPGKLYIDGATITSAGCGVASYYGGTVEIKNSSISGAVVDIINLSATLWLGENVTFPDGLIVITGTLNDYLAEGMVYWQDNKMLTVADDATSIEGTVTVKAECKHENSTLSDYKPTEDGSQHTAIRSCCGTEVTEGHSFDENGKCTHCGYACDHSGHTGGYTTDAETHSFTCTVCQATVAEDHSFNADDGMCSVCDTFVAAASVTKGTADSNADGLIGGNSQVSGDGYTGSATTYYLTLNEAVQAVANCTAGDNAVLKLEQNIDLGEGYQQIDSGVFTIDLNGFTLNSAANNDGALYINGGDVTITDSSEGGNGRINNSKSYGVYVSEASLTINGGTIEAGHSGVKTHGTVTINGGNIIGGYNGVYAYTKKCKVIINDGTITATSVNGVDAFSNADVTINGGEITCTNGYGVSVSSSDNVTITGGSISGTTADILYDDGSIQLTLAEGKTEGATFPGGLTVEGTTLDAILGEGAAYWQGDRMIVPTAGQTEITGGDVTVKACDHSGNTNSYDVTATTHSLTCAFCQTTLADEAPHDYSQNDAHTCICGDVEKYTVILMYSGVEIVNGTVATHGQDLTVELKNTASAVREDIGVVNVFCADESIYSKCDISDDGTIVTIPGEYVTGDVSIYAFALAEVTVKMNGGSCTGDELWIVSGDIATLYNNYNYVHNTIELSSFQREGYTLTGIKDSEGNEYAANQRFEITGDLALTLVWEVNTYDYTIETYTMGLDGQYGEPVTETKSANYGQTVTVEPAEMEGFTFVAEDSILSAVNGTGDTVLKVYYSRNQYELMISPVVVNARSGGTTWYTHKIQVYFGAMIADVIPAELVLYDGAIRICKEGDKLTAAGTITEGIFVAFNGTHTIGKWDASVNGTEPIDLTTATMPAGNYEIYQNSTFTGWVEQYIDAQICTNYVVDSVLQFGWQQIDGSWYYFDKNNSGFRIESGLHEVPLRDGDGETTALHLFEADGVFLEDYTDLYSDVEGKYHVEKGIVVDKHDYTAAYDRSGDTHTAYCACGAELPDQPHDYTHDAENHKCICGYVEHVVLTFDLQGGTVTGQYKEVLEYYGWLLDGKVVLSNYFDFGAAGKWSAFYVEGALVKEGHHITGFRTEDGKFWPIDYDGEDRLVLTGDTTLTVVWEACAPGNTNNLVDNDDGTHRFTCSFCQTEVTEEHTFGYDWVNDRNHTKSCVCGASDTQPHVAKNDGYCICGGFEIVFDCNGGTIPRIIPQEYADMGLTQEEWEEIITSLYGSFDAPEFGGIENGPYSGANFTDNTENLNTTFRKEGHSITGLAYDANGEKPVSGDDIISGPTTIYFVWTPNIYNAVFDAAGGTWADGSTEQTVPTAYNTTITAPEAPTRQGYTFQGWNVEVGTMGAEDKTFTALWQCKHEDPEATVNGSSENHDLICYNCDSEGFKVGTEAHTFVQGVCECTYRCKHEGNTLADLGNGTHGFTCSVCQLDVADFHDFGTTGTCVCTLTAQASITVDGTTTYYEKLQDAVIAAKSLTDSTVKLLKDVDNSVTVYGGKFTLDLGQHTLSSTSEGTVPLHILEGCDVTIRNGTISGYIGVYTQNATVDIDGVVITGVAGVLADNATVTITGGSISGEQFDIYSSESTVTLMLADDAAEGTTFPGGLTVYGTTLDAILDEGAAYWQGGKMIIPTEGQTEIPGGDVTIRKACDHSGNTNNTYTDNGNGTHSILCTICSAAEVTSSHDFGTTGTCVCTLTAQASVTVDGTTTYYEKLQQAVDAAASGSTVKLLKDVDMGNYFVMVDGGTFTLDLDQHTLSTSQRGVGAVHIFEGGDVTIRNGTITGYLGVSADNATVTIENSTISAVSSNGVHARNNSTVTIKGGTITGNYIGVYAADNTTVTISGGSISGERYDIYPNGSNATLMLADDAAEGTTFPGGLTVYGTTLDAILDEGAAYWQGGKMIIPTEGQTEIPGGDVTIRKACDHTGNTNKPEDNGDGTHSLTCSVCGVVRETIGTHEDTDKDHDCDYGCTKSIGTCEDADKDHDCDYGCDKVYGTHEDTDKDHDCDYGCTESIGTCEDVDKDHDCDYGCDKVYGTHEDTDKDHDCDYGCTESIGTCEDADKDHDCDYGCDKVYGTHEDTDKDHDCDYGCTESIGTCEDSDKDHDCDYGCDKVYGTHEDTDKDHDCDYGCTESIGTCEDADKDHDCDYGCDKAYGDHSDSDSDQDYKCDYCGEAMPKDGTQVEIPADDTGTIIPGAPAEIDGKPIVIDWDGEIWLEDKGSKLLVTYKFNEDEDPHKEYPTAMYAWLLKWDGDTCKAIRIPELDNFMTYKGTSIRINHSNDGIRFFTAVPVDALNKVMKGALLTGELEGFKLVEMGTLYKWAATGSELTIENGAKSYVYGGSAGSTYREFSKEGNLSWFTGMLTDMPGDAQTLAKDILSRPYAVFQKGNDTIVLYGGSIQRSIYYVALQNKDTWAVGTAYDNYVEKIISTVEAAKG